MKTRNHVTRISLLALLVLFVSAFTTVRAGQLAEAVILVATPKLIGPYSRTILVAKGIAQERHIGVIINQPTRVSLAALFPESKPSKKINEPVYFGGPAAHDALFAMVQTKQSPGAGSVQFAPDLFLVINAEVIDRIIEQQSDRARFYVGVVLWQPGELAAELARGFWLVKPADTELVLRKHTEGMWDEFIHRAPRAKANFVSAE